MSMDRPQLRLEHLPTLDGWRGVAILAVLCSHIRWPFPVLVQVGQYGAMGVHLFFALSGFLITRRLIEEHQRTGWIDWKAFYIRRVFRILPPAFLYLAAAAGLGLGLHVIAMDRMQLIASAFFFRNYLTETGPNSWYTLHFWSLAVEEHFYLLWPAVLVLAGLRKARFAVAPLALLIALWRGLDGHYQWVAALNPLLKDSVRRTDYRLDILLWGCAAALFWSEPRFREWVRRWAGSAMVGAVLAATAACLWWHPPGYLVALAILMALLPVATVARPDSWVGRILEWGPVSFVGRISYSLYLWQELFFPIFGVQPTLGWLQVFPWNLAPAFGVAAMSYYLVERPFIAWGRVLQKRSRRSDPVGLAPRALTVTAPKR